MVGRERSISTPARWEWTIWPPQTRGSGDSRASPYRCGNLILSRDPLQVCSSRLGLQHTKLANDVPVSCLHCAKLACLVSTPPMATPRGVQSGGLRWWLGFPVWPNHGPPAGESCPGPGAWAPRCPYSARKRNRTSWVSWWVQIRACSRLRRTKSSWDYPWIRWQR